MHRKLPVPSPRTYSITVHTRTFVSGWLSIYKGYSELDFVLKFLCDFCGQKYRQSLNAPHIFRKKVAQKNEQKSGKFSSPSLENLAKKKDRKTFFLGYCTPREKVCGRLQISENLFFSAAKN